MRSFFWDLYRLFLFGSMWTYSFGFYIWSLVNYMLFLWFQFFASWVFVLSTSLVLFFIWSICFASIFVMCSVAFFRTVVVSGVSRISFRGGFKIFLEKWGYLHGAKRHAARGEATRLLGRFRGMLPRENF